MRKTLILAATLAVAGPTVALHWPREARVAAQVVMAQFVNPAVPDAHLVPTTPEAARLITAAEAQVGVTSRYDPAYVTLAFPGGDVPAERGVCTDVVIRALRAGLGIDLQAAVHHDMTRNFQAYPALWGLTRPDANIDHRRVPNLEALFRRTGAEVPIGPTPAAFRPGDIVTSRLPDNRPHVMIVTARISPDGTPLVAHNIGAGVRIENALFDYPLSAQFRLTPDVLARLSGLANQ
ncbi:DUF1287 domain-containing protein [Defluviimonas sp. WL0002]|uniref:DUF1287 domain-containing protein n=1 Tax=Albidovulum marisflavi TaxID=2984159 RepID=A0ABT2ZAP0_9RHOB|nr:DUF1287 domain-containing protein [Defluviimonas sp. WL0002]MCV2868189.1 DUF1287 domain-containing protein [Defluviimonas sp. WL0002]